jgi:hypothetical protein
MPYMSEFQLCEKILVFDINVRICFMSSLDINREGQRDISITKVGMLHQKASYYRLFN